VVAEVLRSGLAAVDAPRELPLLPTYPMGRPLVDLADRDALYRGMDQQ
jgi:hypothetical protein